MLTTWKSWYLLLFVWHGLCSISGQMKKKHPLFFVTCFALFCLVAFSALSEGLEDDGVEVDLPGQIEDAPSELAADDLEDSPTQVETDTEDDAGAQVANDEEKDVVGDENEDEDVDSNENEDVTEKALEEVQPKVLSCTERCNSFEESCESFCDDTRTDDEVKDCQKSCQTVYQSDKNFCFSECEEDEGFLKTCSRSEEDDSVEERSLDDCEYGCEEHYGTCVFHCRDSFEDEDESKACYKGCTDTLADDRSFCKTFCVTNSNFMEICGE